MSPRSGRRPWCARCAGRSDRRRAASADPGRDPSGGFPQNTLRLDPHSGVTVIFRSKRGAKLKILVWDDEPCRAIGPSDNGDRMVLVYKVLEKGSLAWPKVQDGVAGAGAVRGAVCAIAETEAQIAAV